MSAAFACAALACAAQSFEVASVRLSRVVNGAEGRGWPSVEVTPDRVTLRNHSLGDCVQWAYEVKEYQLTGPDWMYGDKYEITGKSAGPASRAGMRPMMRS